jgi:hypothetical protein
MKKLARIIILVLIAGILTGCTSTLDKSASALADQYYQSVQNKEYNLTLPDFSSSFFEKTSQADWILILENMNNKLGDLKSYKLSNWNERTIEGIGNIQSGTTYTLQYDVTYANETDKETLTLFQPKGKQLQITGFNINSVILLK